jgi:hypothetical protein
MAEARMRELYDRQAKERKKEAGKVHGRGKEKVPVNLPGPTTDASDARDQVGKVVGVPGVSGVSRAGARKGPAGQVLTGYPPDPPTRSPQARSRSTTSGGTAGAGGGGGTAGSASPLRSNSASGSCRPAKYRPPRFQVRKRPASLQR